MTMPNLKGLRVAILVTDGFEQAELVEPRKALDAAGAETKIVSPKNDQVRGWKDTQWGDGSGSRNRRQPGFGLANRTIFAPSIAP
jgi:putative intracellular protease/amidase